MLERQKLHYCALFLLILALLAISVSPVLAADPGNNVTVATGGSKDLLPLNSISPSAYLTRHSTEVAPSLQQHTAGSSSSSPNVPTALDPVNLATGNYVYQHQDLTLPGPGLFLGVTRTYNSLIPLSGPFGPGWTFNYNVRLAGISGSDVVLVMWEDGRTDIYNASSSGGTYTPPLGIFDTLTRNTDGTYTVARDDHMTYQFTATGQLTSIADNNGNTINLTYIGSNLTHVTDSSGRGLTFIDNAAGQIIAITDPSGATMRYTYDGNDNLVRFSNATGAEFDYTYDDNHEMTSLSSPDGIRVLNNTYDENGRVIRQSWPPANVDTIDYAANNHMTTISDTSGRKTIYTFDDRGWELSETDDIGNTISYAYDANGNRIDTTDRIGNFIRSACNAIGKIIGPLFD